MRRAMFARHAAGLLSAPLVLFLALFLAAPLVNLVELSVLMHSPTQLWTRVLTGANYLQGIDDYYFTILLRSMRIAGIATAICVILGFPVAYYLARCSHAALALGLFLLIAPLMVSTVIRAFGWHGLLNQVLGALGLEPWPIMYTESAVVIGVVQLVLPLMVLPTMAAIENIPVDLEEAAVNLGCGPMSCIGRVLLPLSMPGLISGAILSFAVGISVIVTPALLGGRRGRMIGNEIYDQVITGLNWPFASALSVLLICVILVMVGAGRTLGRLQRSNRQSPRHAAG
jgi:putative spermidine/putrescine transport system permease protein